MGLKLSKEGWEREHRCVFASRDEFKVGQPCYGICTQNVSLRKGDFKEQLREKESMLTLYLTTMPTCMFVFSKGH